jgi:aspartyl aminopeptidase
MLTEAGFVRLAEEAEWPAEPGRYFIVRGGTLVAWALPSKRRPYDGFRIVGAHTDSPNLRVKPQPDMDRAGAGLLGVEAYGGVLLASWMDRDLGLSGRVAVRRNGAGAAVKLLRVDRPVCTIPQLAIHLNREVNVEGLDALHAQLDRGQRLMELLKQGQYSPFATEDQVVSIWAGTTGQFDDVPTEDVRRFEDGFLEYLRLEHSSVLEAIRESGKFGDDTADALKSAIEEFKKTFETSAGTLLGTEEEAEALESEDVGQETIKISKRGGK